MANWTVVVWAAVTPDLVSAIEADLREVKLAVDALGGTIDLHVAPTHDSVKVIMADGDAMLRLQKLGVSFLSPATSGTELRAALKPTGWKASDKRMLVMWGHGAHGLRGHQFKQLAVPAAELVVKAFTGRGAPPDPEIVGYDACRMASAPTVLTLAEGLPEAIFIGSMIPEPASGWPYSELLRILAAHSDPEAAAAAIVQSYAASVDVADWCLLALKLSQIRKEPDSLATALTLLEKTRPPGAAEFCAAASGADTLDDTDMVDLGALMRRLSDRTAGRKAAKDLRKATGGVRDAIRNATIARRASGNLAGRDGLSVQVMLPRLPSISPMAPDKGMSTGPTWTGYLEAGAFPG